MAAPILQVRKVRFSEGRHHSLGDTASLAEPGGYSEIGRCRTAVSPRGQEAGISPAQSLTYYGIWVTSLYSLSVDSLDSK